MQMTVGELIERLQDFPEDATVRLASQPNWPFEYSIQGVTTLAEATQYDEDREYDADDEEGDENGVVYIVEGSQLGYTSKSLWNC
jgi:hypothetical protein